MKFPLETIQFAARLINDDLELLNEAIPEILPDADLKDDKALTGRAILMGAVEAAVSKITRNKKSLPEDLEKIKVLEAQIIEMGKAVQDHSILNGNLKELTDELTARNQVIEELENRISELTGSVGHLEKYKPVENEMRIVVQPFTLKALILYAQKVSKKVGKEVQPGTVLTSLFNRYVTKRETEFDGFPFVLSETELINIKESLKKPANEPVK